MSTFFLMTKRFTQYRLAINAVGQETLRHKHVAIKGICYRWYPPLLTLTRLGIDAFLIANFVVFSLQSISTAKQAPACPLGRKLMSWRSWP